MYYPTLLYYHSITIDHTKVAADVTNMTVVLTAANFNNDIKTLGGGLSPRSDGGDLRFFTDATLATPIPFDIVNFTQDATPANAVIEINAKLNVSSSVDTTLYVGWGDPNLTGLSASDTYGQYNAYKSGFALWCPMKDDPNNTHVLDRTSNARSGTKATSTKPTQGTSSGRLVQYEAFVNSGDNSSWIDFSGFNTGNQFIVFVPFKFTGVAGHGYDRIVSNKTNYNDANGFELALVNASSTQLQVTGSSATQWNATVFTNILTDGWENLAVRFNGAAVDIFNLTTKSSNAAAITSVVNNANTITVGNSSSGTHTAGLSGNVDQGIIYIGTMVDGEITAMQNNQYSPATFAPTIGNTTSVSSSSLLMKHNELFDNMSNLNM